MIVDIFEVWILLDCFVFLVSPFDEVKSVCSEYSVQLLIQKRVLLFLEILLKYLADEVDHGLEEVLVLEYKFTLPVTQQNPHVYVTYFFALLLQLMTFPCHQVISKPSAHDLLLVQLLMLPYHHHVLEYILEQFSEKFAVDEVLKLFGNDQYWIFCLFLHHARVIGLCLEACILMQELKFSLSLMVDSKDCLELRLICAIEIDDSCLQYLFFMRLRSNLIPFMTIYQ